ncbi:MAG: histidine kinase, partial [Synechococcaceae bacterium WB5_2A_257]|nr:histidine kinase [Synechococcaceae bacterium WB5_2A_257]
MKSPSGALLLRFALFLLLSWGATLVLLQLLLGQRLERAQMQQMGRNLAGVIRLSEVGLESFPPAVIAQQSGLRLATNLPIKAVKQGNRDRELRLELCKRLRYCPEVRLSNSKAAGV